VAEVTVTQVVPPWGRAFQGSLRFRVVEDTQPYEHDIKL
jgi:hypothetical protein